MMCLLLTAFFAYRLRGLPSGQLLWRQARQPLTWAEEPVMFVIGASLNVFITLGVLAITLGLFRLAIEQVGEWRIERALNDDAGTGGR